ncbi:MAG: ABC transporter substrate-binding protein [Spirochaetaceae bacterium]
MKPKFTKLIMMFLMTMICSSLFASGNNEKPAGTEKVEKKQKRELTAMLLQSRNFDGLQEMIAKLEAEENIVIDLQVIPDDQYDNLLKIKVNSGVAPDIMDYNVPHIYDILDPDKHFEDLSDQPWVSKLVNPSLSEYNGKTYSYTFMSTAGYQAMIYNKDVFDKFGLEIPTTVAEFENVCNTLKAGGVTPMLLASDIWVPQIWMTAGYSRALGSTEAAQDFADKILTNQAKFTDYPQVVAAVDEYLSMFEKGWMNDDFITLNVDGVVQKLGTGAGAMFFGSLGLANNVEKAFPEGNFGMFNIPTSYDKKDVISGTVFSYGFVVNKDSKNKDLAKEVFNHFASPEYADIYFADRPGFPALTDTNGGELKDYAQKVYDDYVVTGKMVPEMNLFLNPLGALNGSTIWVYYQEAPVKGNMDGYQLLDRYQQDVNKFMTEQKAPGW